MTQMSAQDAQLQFALEETTELQQILILKIATLKVNHQIEVNELRAEIDRLQSHIEELQKPSVEQGDQLE